MEREELLKIGITHGEGNKLNYELLVKLFSKEWGTASTPFIYGVPQLLEDTAKAMAVEEFRIVQIRQESDIKGKGVHVYDVNKKTSMDEQMEENVSDPSLRALELSKYHGTRDRIKALVTLPWNKENLNQKYPHIKNQTHYIASSFKGNSPFRILLLSDIRLSFLSSNQIAEVRKTITRERLLQRIRFFKEVLQQDFGCTSPRIAVMTMNEDLGATELCEEDKNITQNLLVELFQQGIHVMGPYLPKDFDNDIEALGRFDGILCIYKEQSTYLLKDRDLEGLSYFTARLPLIHLEMGLSVEKEDEVSKNRAVNNLMNTLHYAEDIYRCRTMYRHLTKNPLNIQKKDVENI